MLISISSHNSGPNSFHSIGHFLTSVSDDICFTSTNIYRLSYENSNNFQVVHALQPSLMVVLGPHYLNKDSKHGQIKFLSQYFHPDSIPLIGNSSSQGF